MRFPTHSWSLKEKGYPAPSADREREYVTGHAKQSGGIQRFKLALHGAQQTTAAIVGYVQAGNTREWLSRINEWIGDDAKNKGALEEKLVTGGTTRRF